MQQVLLSVAQGSGKAAGGRGPQLAEPGCPGAPPPPPTALTKTASPFRRSPRAVGELHCGTPVTRALHAERNVFRATPTDHPARLTNRLTGFGGVVSPVPPNFGGLVRTGSGAREQTGGFSPFPRSLGGAVRRERSPWRGRRQVNGVRHLSEASETDTNVHYAASEKQG